MVERAGHPVVAAALIGLSLLAALVVDLVLLPDRPIAWVYGVPLLLAAMCWPPTLVAALGVAVAVVGLANNLFKGGEHPAWPVYTAGVAILAAFAVFLARERRRLRENRALLRAAIDQFPNGSVNVFDRDLRYLYVGGQGLGQVGLSPDKLVGKTLAEVFEPGAVAYAAAHYRRAFAGESVEFPLEVGGRTYAIAALPLRADGGAVGAVLAVAQDVSERLALERMQREFVAMVTHELRGPLTGIRGFAQLMRRRGAYDERALDRIVGQTQHLERLVADLLDASRLETGHLELRRRPAELVAVVRACVEQARAQPDPPAIRLEAPDVPVRGDWDPDRLSQVFTNLLGNAVKYGAGGEIVVRVAAGDAEVRVSVADRGPGIPPEALPRLFDRFYRAEGAGRREGLGLGLYITRGIVEAHGGRITADSRLGEGSTFAVELPLRPPEPPAC